MVKKLKSTVLNLFGGASQPVLSFLFLAAIIGAVLGSISGCLFNSGLSGFTLEGYSAQFFVWPSFWTAALDSFKYLALAVLFSTSFLGIVLVPALALVMAYSFSCAIAALFAAYSFSALLVCFFALAVPALFLFPCLFIAYRDSFCHAKQLLEFKLSRNFAPVANRLIRDLILIVIVLVAVSLYNYFLLPNMLSTLI